TRRGPAIRKSEATPGGVGIGRPKDEMEPRASQFDLVLSSADENIFIDIDTLVCPINETRRVTHSAFDTSKAEIRKTHVAWIRTHDQKPGPSREIVASIYAALPTGNIEITQPDLIQNAS